jgi:pimeloyl-ACP methyl ester carboxylesterase
LASDVFNFCKISPDGLNVAYVSRGTGPLVIFLHGFPDTHRGFLAAMELVAAAGYRAVAPEPRGYAPTDVPTRANYLVEHFAQDVISLADALGAHRFSIVGHDWGALTAYAAANLAPLRIERLVTAAVPHTAHFLLGMRLQQAWRSRYMLYFQFPQISEWWVRRNDFAYIENLIHAWAPTWQFDEATLEPLKEAFGDSRRLTAALSYYRGLLPSILSTSSRKLIFKAVSVPTRILFGTEDGCIAPEAFSGQQKWFAQKLEVHSMHGVGHFMQWERPKEFASKVLGFLPSRQTTTG